MSPVEESEPQKNLELVSHEAKAQVQWGQAAMEMPSSWWMAAVAASQQRGTAMETHQGNNLMASIELA